MVSHRAVRCIGLGWIGFVGENLVLSENREKIIEVAGERNYHLGYSTLSTCACGLIGYGYWHGRRLGPRILLQAGLSRRFGALCCQGLGLAGVSQSFPTLRSPADFVSAWCTPGADPGSRANMCPIDFRASDGVERPEDGRYGERSGLHVIPCCFPSASSGSAPLSVHLSRPRSSCFPSR